jgi:hypothetical protein
MSSIAPSTMFMPAGPAVNHAPERWSRFQAAAFLVIASMPAVLFGGRPAESFGAIAKIIAIAVSGNLPPQKDLSSK